MVQKKKRHQGQPLGAGDGGGGRDGSEQVRWRGSLAI